VEIGVASRYALGERKRVPSVDEDVETPAFDLRPLILPGLEYLQLFHPP
jgi:hypothetical protein